MNLKTRSQRRMAKSFLTVVTGVSIASMVFAPTLTLGGEKPIISNEGKLYKVVINDQDMGYVSSIADANEAYQKARLSLNENGLSYVDADFSVYETNLSAKADKVALEAKILESLKNNVVSSNLVEGYTIKIDDFSVTVASKEEAVKVLENVKKDFDSDNLFQINLSASDDGEYGVLVKESSITSVDIDRVSAHLEGEQAIVNPITENTVIQDGLLTLGFSENIEIIPTKTVSDAIVSVDDAANAITKKTAAKETYTIQSGDCLYDVALKYDMSLDQLYAMNDGLTETSILLPGDKLVVTVPTPEVSVITVKAESYDEEFYADVQYIDDDTMYIGQTAVVVAGTPGYRHVDVAVTYKNNVAVSKQIIDQNVVSEPVAKVVKRGTLTAPTYIMPVVSYFYISEYFGYRDWTASFHGGIDLAASTGTVVRAARSGYVSYAGWKGSYGNCIEITHGDGHITRYAHLNSIAVSVGQSVTQYETIGYVGSTGFSTGPHLHFEIIINNVQVNPLSWL